jgi:hypothetical protein
MLKQRLARLLDVISQWLYPHDEDDCDGGYPSETPYDYKPLPPLPSPEFPPIKGIAVGDRFTDAFGRSFVWCQVRGPAEVKVGHFVTADQVMTTPEEATPPS